VSEVVVSQPTAPEAGRVVARVAVPGLAASSVLAVGSLGAGWMAPASGMGAHPLIDAVRSSEVGASLAKLLVVVAAGALVRIWVRARPLARGLGVVQAQQLGAVGLVWSVPLLVAPVLFSRDVFSYIALSRLPSAGIDPYQHGTGVLSTSWSDGADPMWFDAPAPYGPVWILASSALFRLTDAEPTAALLGFRLLALAGVGLLAVFVPRLAVRAGADPGTAAWLAVLNPMVLFHFGVAAHNDALMVGLLIAGLALALGGRVGVGVAVVTLAGLVKAPALLALPFLAVYLATSTPGWRIRIRVGTTVLSVALAVAAATTVAAGVGVGWVANLATPTEVDTWLSPSTALGRTIGLVAEAGELASADSVLHVARLAGLVVAALMLGWLLLTARRRPLLRTIALALLAVVVLGPVVHPWYLLWPLPLLAVSVTSRRELGWIVGASLGLATYTVANTAATSAALFSVGDGVAVLAAAVVALAIALGPRLGGRRGVRGPAAGRAADVAEPTRDRLSSTSRAGTSTGRPAWPAPTPRADPATEPAP